MSAESDDGIRYEVVLPFGKDKRWAETALDLINEKLGLHGSVREVPT